jgi:hypothetical protein
MGEENMSSGPHALKPRTTPHQLGTGGIIESPYGETGAHIRSSRPRRASHALAFEAVTRHEPLFHLQGKHPHSPCQLCRRRRHASVIDAATAPDSATSLRATLPGPAVVVAVDATPLHLQTISASTCSKTMPLGGRAAPCVAIVRSGSPRPRISPGTARARG